MNRRHFLVLSASAAALMLSACKDNSLADKFTGFWVDGSKRPTYIKISREGESFLIDIRTLNMLNSGYMTRRLAGSIDDKANNTIVADGGLKLVLSESKDKLFAGNSTFTRMAEDKYNDAMAEIDAKK